MLDFREVLRLIALLSLSSVTATLQAQEMASEADPAVASTQDRNLQVVPDNAAPITTPDPYAQTVPVQTTETQAAEPPKRNESRSTLIEEIVVTAQKREQSVQDVGIAISAFSGDALEQLGIQDTSQISDLVPGFTFAESGYSVPIYTIRGVGFNDISQAGSSTVGVYVDEVILPYPAMTKGANLDLERVEVLKGPQGTLYGRNTTGGAVNYIARRPTQTFESDISASYGRFQTAEAEAHVSGPLTDTLGARFAIRGIHAGDWQYDYTRPGVDYGKERRGSARGLLDWQASEDLTVKFSLDGWLDKSDPQSPQGYVFLDQSAIVSFAPSQRFLDHPLAPNNDARATALDPGKDFYLDETFVNASVRADWALSEQTTFTGIVSHQQYKNDNHFNTDGVNVEEFEYFVKTDIPATTAEARLAGKSFNDTVNWVAGLFYSHDVVDEYRDFFLKDNSTGDGGRTGIFDNIVLQGKQKSDTEAVFGQAEWQATDDFKYTLGLRYTREQRDNFNCTRDKNGDTALVFSALEIAAQAGLGGLVGAGLTNEAADTIIDALAGAIGGIPDTPAALNTIVDTLTRVGAGSGLTELIGGVGLGECFTISAETGQAGPTIGKLNENNVSGKAAVDWTPIKDLRVYGSFSVGYKSGSFPLVPSSNSQQAEPVTQERVNAYEIGLKSSFWDGELRLNGAVFHYDYFDKQLFAFYRDQIFGTLQRLDNVPRSRIDGLELEAQYSPVRELFVSLSAAVLDSEVKKYTGIDANGENVNFAGNNINYTPPLEVSLLVNYELPVTSSGYTAIFGADANYSAKTDAELSNDPRFERDAYTVFGARVGLRSPDARWTLTAFGKNLGNEVYYTSLQRLSDIGVRYTGRPRTYGLTLDYEF